MKKIFEYRNKNMNREHVFSIISFIVAVFMVGAFVSCDGNILGKGLDEVQEREKVPALEYVDISFSTILPVLKGEVGDSSEVNTSIDELSRKLVPSTSPYSNMIYRLTGIADNSGKEELLGHWGSLQLLLSDTQTLHTGNWTFILTAYAQWSTEEGADNSNYAVLQDSKIVTLTENVTLEFTLKEIEACAVSGSFEYTVRYPASQKWSVALSLKSAVASFLNTFGNEAAPVIWPNAHEYHR